MSHALEAIHRHGKSPGVLRTVDDIDRFIDELANAGWEYTSASVYAIDEDTKTSPDHEFIIGVDQETGLGALRYAGDDGEWFSKGEHVNPNGVVFVYFGTGHDFPADAEVPLSVVRQAMRELLANKGKRPACVVWQRWS